MAVFFISIFSRIAPSNEPRGANGYNENTQRYNSWIFNQQLTYDNTFDKHSLKVIALHEAQLSNFRQIGGSLNNYFLTSQSLWYLQTGLADPATRNVSSSGNKGPAKESYMGRVQYASPSASGLFSNAQFRDVLIAEHITGKYLLASANNNNLFWRK